MRDHHRHTCVECGRFYLCEDDDCTDTNENAAGICRTCLTRADLALDRAEAEEDL